MNERVRKLMMALDVSEAEAKQIIADDKAIDQGKNLFPLSAEQEKVSKKMRGVGRQPTAYKLTPREKKENPEKQQLIDALSSAARAFGATYVGVSNPEREFSFVYNGTTYKVVMSCPRK